MGYLGYDVVREVEHLPNVPRDDAGLPDAILHVIGQLCAFDHWRQRVVLVDNVVVGEDWDDAEASAAFDAAGTAPRRSGRRRCSVPWVARRWRRPEPTTAPPR